jgi:hypothetical protein
MSAHQTITKPARTPGRARGIGAGASVVTQVIRSITSGKREKRRFAWGRDTQKREWNRQERDRFLLLKRELYSSYAFEIGSLLGYIRALNNSDTPVARRS